MSEKITELAHMVIIRNHLDVLQNGSRNAVTRPQLREIGSLIHRLDKEIVSQSLNLFNQLGPVEEPIDISGKIAAAKAALQEKIAVEAEVTVSTSKPKASKAAKVSNPQ